MKPKLDAGEVTVDDRMMDFYRKLGKAQGELILKANRQEARHRMLVLALIAVSAATGAMVGRVIRP